LPKVTVVGYQITKQELLRTVIVQLKLDLLESFRAVPNSILSY